MRMLDGKVYINFEAESFVDLYTKTSIPNCFKVLLCLEEKERKIILEFPNKNELFVLSLYITSDSFRNGKEAFSSHTLKVKPYIHLW